MLMLYHCLVFWQITAQCVNYHRENIDITEKFVKINLEQNNILSIAMCVSTEYDVLPILL